MNNKIVVFIYVVGVASASVVAPVPVAARVADVFPQYSYGYDVQDSLTGDYKGHQENRNGDLVTGSYSVVDPDGTRRIVDYTADPLNGFNAIVRREPLIVPAARVIAPAPVPAPAPLIAPAPAPVYARAPVFAPAPAPAPLLAPRLPYYW